MEKLWAWQSNRPGKIHIQQNNQKLIYIKYKKSLGKISTWLGGGAFSILEDKLIFCNNWFQAKFGLSSVKYEFSKDSPIFNDFNDMGINKPILSILGENMRGYMGKNTQVVSFLPGRINREKP